MKVIKKIAFILISILALTSCRSLNKYSRMIYAMETIITVNVYTTTEAEANVILNDVEAIYLNYSKLASDYDTYTNITNVKILNENREGIVSEELYELLKYAFEIKEKTNGYFEPFIGNLAHKWKNDVLTADTPSIPSKDYIETELENIKNSSIEFLDNNKIKLNGTANIDLGAIAKGYATEKVHQYFKNGKITNYLVNAGKSSVLVSTKPNGKEFTMGLLKVDYSGYYDTLKVKNKGVATSSYREQQKTIDGVLYTHLINPKTGYPSANYASLTVIGDDSSLLDAYSTALYFMNVNEINEFIADKNIDVIVYGVNNLIFSTLENDK